jgi:hypothetical protein
VRISVIHAFDGDLVDVGAEELSRELLRALRREAVICVDLATLNPLEHEHSFRHV